MHLRELPGLRERPGSWTRSSQSISKCIHQPVFLPVCGSPSLCCRLLSHLPLTVHKHPDTSLGWPGEVSHRSQVKPTSCLPTHPLHSMIHREMKEPLCCGQGRLVSEQLLGGVGCQGLPNPHNSCRITLQVEVERE